MAKRNAGNYLTDQNWQDEEEVEEAGRFVQASAVQLKGREIKRAKRRVANGTSSSSASAFSGFGGFCVTNSTPSKELQHTSSFPSTEQADSSTTISKIPADKERNNNEVQIGTKSIENNSIKDGDSEEILSAKYLASLKALNESVSRWIKMHVDKNPHCWLTPIFDDYTEHLKSIEQLKGKVSISKDNGKDLKSDIPEGKSSLPGQIFVGKKNSSASQSASEEAHLSALPEKIETFPKPVSIETKSSDTLSTKSSAPFGLGIKSGAASGGEVPSFSFGDSASATESKSSFSFGAVSTAGTGGFSFASGMPTASATQEEESYEPPKVESVEHKEEGAIYSKKAKLFYQSEGKWMERGIGILYLKLIDSKPQLLIRTDTATGNILLNIQLHDSMPLKRVGKNNIVIVCIPNPPIPQLKEIDKPMNMMIRVKTEADANELHDHITKLKSN